ncbi:MAG TPA: zinc ABC transporter substrate-binding protein, partial [Xanthobacteraceae bacterium]|nr:zinc ABC transporter substrate-binding protein [Xanthobacteraceae bacterium]
GFSQKERRVITSHDAFHYFGDAYAVEFLAVQGAGGETQASAAQVARLIRQIKKEGVRAVFVENISDPRLIQQIAKETGAKLGGTLYSDALSDAGGPAATYIDMMRHNARTIAAALR